MEFLLKEGTMVKCVNTSVPIKPPEGWKPSAQPLPVRRILYDYLEGKNK